MDEHRVGLKPILRRVWARRVWARRGKRPVIEVRPRYEWLYIYAFVCPETGETEFWLAPGVDSALFGGVIEAFARKRKSEHLLLVLDRAGWHVSKKTRSLEAGQENLELVFLPPRSPELQPAERLWELCDEPAVNQVFEKLADLEAALAERCVELTEQRERIRSLTLYHWWPGGADHTATA